MNCFITGATGFIGANLVAELRAQGHAVRALVRPGADLRALAGLTYEKVAGALDDAEALRKGMNDCDWCFHVAASYHLWLPDYAPMYQANVEGTRNVLLAAQAAGCQRIVYTSTVGCIGLPRANERGEIEPTDEETPVSEAQMSNHYKISKWRGEVVARELAAQGLPIVIVNPSAPVGPRDAKPTPTGKIIVDFLNRKLPAFLETGLNWVHVRDVAQGHILAAEKGRVGQRYILGNLEGNWTFGQTLRFLEGLTGIPAPRLKVPYWVALAAAQVEEQVARLTGKEPKASLAGVRMAKYKMFFNPRKAVEELGLPQTPPSMAFADAISWFRQNKYAPAGNGD